MCLCVEVGSDTDDKSIFESEREILYVLSVKKINVPSASFDCIFANHVSFTLIA